MNLSITPQPKEKERKKESLKMTGSIKLKLSKIYNEKLSAHITVKQRNNKVFKADVQVKIPGSKFR